MSRNKTTRQKQILMELGQSPSLRVNELARHLSVSAETIRRDLDELKRDGLIDRTYGGAIRRPSAEPALNERLDQLVKERAAIARAAVPYLADARHVMLGSGATTVHVARRMAVEMRDMTVITHSFGVASALALNPTIAVVMVPGRYHASEGALHGAETIQFLHTLNADWAVLGASGLSDAGPSDALLDAGHVYATMLERASRSLVVADASKFNLAFPSAWASWSHVDLLVSDQAPGGALSDGLTEAGVEVRLAGGAS
ncbi:MAG: DeoR/GlpR family DNA-binding transcription regulator [Pseudomonadota bacterium]